MADSTPGSAQHWDQRYQESERLWSGQVNAAVETIAQDLEPGRALDLGCGEGADALWLAGQGWQVTGVDISQVAVQRATEAAQEQGFTQEQVRFVTADVTTWESADRFDLVVAAFLHSHGSFDRGAALQTAQAHVGAQGWLVIVSHASFPPWAKAHHEDAADHDQHNHDATTPQSELDLLQLDAAGWQVQRAEIQSRDALGPEGQQAALEDTLVVARRVGHTP